MKLAGEENKKLTELTAMVLKDRRTNLYGAVPVPPKAIDSHEHTVRQVLRCFGKLGYSVIILTSDQ